MRFIVLLVSIFLNSTSHAEVIDPVDSENQSHLIVMLAKLPVGEEYYYAEDFEDGLRIKAEGQDSSQQIPYNKDIRLAPGNYCLTTRYVETGYCKNITLAPGQTLKIQMAALNIGWEWSFVTPDFGPPAALHLGSAYFDMYHWGIPGEDYYPWFADTYSIDVTVDKVAIPNTKFEFTLEEGKSYELDAPFSKQVSTLKISGETPTFETVARNSCDIDVPVTIADDLNNVYIDSLNTNHLGSSKGAEIGHYSGGMFKYGPFEIEIVPGYGQLTAVEFKRLEVNDVEITTETGTKYSVPGRWSVQKQNSDGTYSSNLSFEYFPSCGDKKKQSTSIFDTKIGLFVLAGKYRVTIDYKTVAGKQSKTFDVSL